MKTPLMWPLLILLCAGCSDGDQGAPQDTNEPGQTVEEAVEEPVESAGAIEFDDQKSVRELLAIVSERIAAGEDQDLVFTTGQFKLFAAPGGGGGGEPAGPTQQPSDLEISFDDENYLGKVESWILNHEVKNVVVRLDLEVPSKAFFELEKALSFRNVAYTVVRTDHERERGLHLMAIPQGAIETPRIEGL